MTIPDSITTFIIGRGTRGGGSGIIIGVKSAGFPGVCDEFSPESDLSVNCGIEFSLPFILFFWIYFLIFGMYLK